MPERPAGVLRAAAYGSTALAWLYALVSAYWAAGGTWLLSTVGGQIAELARRGGTGAVVIGAAVVLLKVAGGVLGLALVQPWGRRLPARLLEPAALAVGGLLTLYGLLNVVLGWLGLLGVFGRPSDPTALRWHVLVWDLWFLLWGVMLLVAVVLRRHGRRPVGGRV